MGYRRKVLEAKHTIKRRKKRLINNANYTAAQRQCFKKVAYISEKRILQKITEIAEEGRKGLRYYQCPFCDLWHISSHKVDGQTFIS